MLPAGHRMRSRDDFVVTARRGRRAARSTVVVHLLTADPADPAPAAPRVGFVVGRAVGGSVVRHRVVRRLRGVVGARLDRLPAGSRVVVRALPASADASFQTLSADVDAALGRLLERIAA